MKPYLLDLIGDKNHLQVRTCVSKYAFGGRQLDCDFHTSIRNDAIHGFLPYLQEKVNFTENNDPGSTELEVRSDVWIFSPLEIKTLATNVEYALNVERDKVKKLEGLVLNFSAQTLHPVYIVEPASYGKGVEDGRKEFERLEKGYRERIDDLVRSSEKNHKRISQLEDEVAGKEERLANQAKSITRLQDREKEACSVLNRK